MDTDRNTAEGSQLHPKGDLTLCVEPGAMLGRGPEDTWGRAFLATPRGQELTDLLPWNLPSDDSPGLAPSCQQDTILPSSGPLPPAQGQP